jgi:Tfp pilus assembly protein PilN
MGIVQFNLLPDVKLEFNRVQKAKKFVYSLATLSIASVLALVILSFLVVNVFQAKLLSDANKDIETYSSKIQSIPDIEKILTIQNQLHSLPALHQKKHYSSRLFTYLPKITPSNVFIGKLDLNTAETTISIDGTAKKVENVNQFVDTLKFTTFTTDQDTSNKKKAFSNVILSKVSRNDTLATYSITANFDPALFTGTISVQLEVPDIITTRSVIDQPGAANQLFNGQTNQNTTNNTTNQGTQ